MPHQCAALVRNDTRAEVAQCAPLLVHFRFCVWNGGGRGKPLPYRSAVGYFSLSLCLLAQSFLFCCLALAMARAMEGISSVMVEPAAM